MLAQNFRRRDSAAQGRTIEVSHDRRRPIAAGQFVRLCFEVPLRILCVSVLIVSAISCGSRPTDPRTVVPADALVYLETADVGKVLDAITSNPKFQQLARTAPDTSFLHGIRLSIAVTGFQASEKPVSEGNAILDFKPHFVAVVETNAWNYQALSFTENKLGGFINEIYGGEVELVTSEKHGGTYFTWTGNDGRKAFALVRDSLIMFGNDETAIDNCVRVMNGNAQSIAANAKVSAFAPDSLASGYVSKDGVAQIANIVAVSLAIGAGEEAEVRNFISRVVPEVVRNSVTEVTWASRRLENGNLEDTYSIELEKDTAKVLSETLVAGSDPDPDLSRFIPIDHASATRYNFKDAQIAWRSVLLTAGANTDQVSGGLLTAFSSSLFEPYGVDDAETFLSAVGSPIQTVRFDPEGDEVAATARIVKMETLKRAVAKEFVLSKQPEKFENADLWRSADGDLAMATVEDRLVIGEAKSVERCLIARNQGRDLATLSTNAKLGDFSAPVVTFGTDADPRATLVAVLSEKKGDNAALTQEYSVESRFSQNGIERRTVSDFGLVGAIIGRLDPGN